MTKSLARTCRTIDNPHNARTITTTTSARTETNLNRPEPDTHDTRRTCLTCLPLPDTDPTVARTNRPLEDPNACFARLTESIDSCTRQYVTRCKSQSAM